MKNLSVTQGGVTTLYSLGNPADFQDEESFKVKFLLPEFVICGWLIFSHNRSTVTWSLWGLSPPSTWTSTSWLQSLLSLLSSSLQSLLWPCTGRHCTDYVFWVVFTQINIWILDEKISRNYWIQFFRRRRNPDPLKEIDYDIRENIINYEVSIFVTKWFQYLSKCEISCHLKFLIVKNSWLLVIDNHLTNRI